MTAFADLNGERIVSGSITVPLYGAWTGDVVLATPAAISSACVVTLGNLTLIGHAFRMASFAGSRSVRLVGGYGGWRKQVTAQAYQDPKGVRLSMVLGDAAAAVGEQVAISQDAPIGLNFVREAAPAERVLRQLAGALWYVDPSGVTRLDARDSSAIGSEFQVIMWSGGKGLFQIATEDNAAWMPGRTFTAPTVTEIQTVSMTTLQIDNDGKLRLEVLSEGDRN